MKPAPDGETRDALVARLRAIQHAGDHRRAVDEAAVGLVRFPADRDLLLIRTTGLRFAGDVEGAQATLDRLATRNQDFSLVHQERGLAMLSAAMRRRRSPRSIGSRAFAG